MARVLVLLAFVAGCKSAPPVPPLPPEIVGTVTIEGDPKVRVLKDLFDDAFCASCHHEQVPFEDYVIGEGRTLANVLVYVKWGAEGVKRAAAGSRVLDQVGCMFTPHVLSMTLGETLDVVSQDRTAHNVNLQSKFNRSFNISMFTGDAPLQWTPTAPELGVPVHCQVHPWMSAWVHVLDHPWHAVTDKNGRYSIKGLPAGDYELVFQHEKLGTKTGWVHVEEQGPKACNMTLKYEPK